MPVHHNQFTTKKKNYLMLIKPPLNWRPRSDSSVDGDTKTVPCNHKLYEAFISSYKPKNDYTTDIIQFHGIGGIVYFSFKICR